MRLLYSSESSPDERLVRALAELHRVDTASDLDEGGQVAAVTQPDAVVCDLHDAQPEVLAGFRKAAPRAWLVAILPAGREDERLALLRAGADAVFARPYVFREISARLDAFARRALQEPAGPSAVEVSVEPADRAVLLGRERVRLSEREFALMALLVGKAGHAASVEEILGAVWGEEGGARPELVHTYVARLREKLERGRPWRLIHGARGQGYRFAALPAEGAP